MSASAVPGPSAGPAPPLRDRRSSVALSERWFRDGHRSRVARRAAALLVGVVLAMVVGASPAQAHAELVRSDPGDGATLTQSPHDIRLWFSEAISQRVSRLRLIGADGSVVAGTQQINQGDRHLLELALPNLGAGAYVAVWQVRSADDGHTTNGTVVFSVGVVTGAVLARRGGSSDSPAPFDVAMRWARICALAGLVGALAVTGLVLPRNGGSDPPERLMFATRAARRRILNLGVGCACLGALVGVAALMPLQEPGRSWVSTVSELLGGTRWGFLWLAQLAVWLALVPVIVALRDRPETQERRPALALIAGAGTVALVWIEALVSHAASVESGHDVALVADAVHILAACLWLGSLAVLVLLLVPPRTGPDTPTSETVGVRALVGACRKPFTRLVAASVVVVVVTGLYSAGIEVVSVGDLAGTSYGRTLLIKLGLLALLLGLGAANSTRMHGATPWSSMVRRPGLARPLHWRHVAIEASVGVLLLVAVGLLVETAPPRVQAVAEPTPQAEARSGTLADLVVSVSVTPNRPGLNGFTMVAASTRRPAPAPIDGAHLELPAGGGLSVVALQQVGPDRYVANAQLEDPDVTIIDVVVQRAGQSLTVPVAWRVGPAQGSQPARISPRHPLAPFTNGLALALVVGVALAGTVHRVRRWPAPRQEVPTAGQSPEAQVPVPTQVADPWP